MKELASESRNYEENRNGVRLYSLGASNLGEYTAIDEISTSGFTISFFIAHAEIQDSTNLSIGIRVDGNLLIRCILAKDGLSFPQYGVDLDQPISESDQIVFKIRDGNVIALIGSNPVFSSVDSGVSSENRNIVAFSKKSVSVFFKLFESAGSDVGLTIKNLKSAPLRRDEFEESKTCIRKLLADGLSSKSIPEACSMFNKFVGYIDSDNILAFIESRLKQRAAVISNNEIHAINMLLEEARIEEKANNVLGEYLNIVPEPILEARDVSVVFKRRPDLRLSFKRLWKDSEANEEFNVLNGVNFKLYTGDILGIIGHNGAGKSTLLRTLNGLVPLSSGSISIKEDRMLLSPGLGIKEELTGRENIEMVCCFMGLSSSEVDRVRSEIEDFSELGTSLNKPFKYYSDGMKSRLVFSIATSVKPSILLIDELLNAGDLKFQEKAVKRMDSVITNSSAVIIVTHSIEYVKSKCNRVLLLHKGEQIYFGNPKTAVGKYLELLEIEKPLNTRIADDLLNSSICQTLT